MAKAGDVALFRGKEDSLIDDIIEFFTKPPYTHSGFFINENMLVEAWWNGVRLRDMTNETEYDVFRIKTPLTQEQIDKGVEYAKSKIHTRYNFLALVGIAIEKIFKTKKNIFYSKYAEICSELVTEIIEVEMNKEVPINGQSDDSSISPADLGSWREMVKIESH